MPKINVYVPDDLAVEVRKWGVPVSATCQRALQEEVYRMEAAVSTEFEILTVEVGEERRRREAFRGRWLVEATDDSRSGEPGQDAGMCWGVALTAKGQIAVYRYHVNDGYPASLTAYDTVDEARADGLPDDIADEADGELGVTIWRDI